MDENVQIECKLFDYLLIRSQQKKYFQSINAPAKPPGYRFELFKIHHFRLFQNNRTVLYSNHQTRT